MPLFSNVIFQSPVIGCKEVIENLWSGLGLSICKGIVEGLGGKIWIESTEGLGTIVYFTIPRGNTT
jgi:signal transduction histidine kinase